MPHEQLTITCYLIDQACPVAEFHYQNQMNAKSYEIKLTLSLQQEQDLLGKHCQVVIHYFDRKVKQTFTGTVFEMTFTPFGANNEFNTKLKLACETKRLWKNLRSGIFYGPKLNDVIHYTLIKGMSETHTNQYTQVKNSINQEDPNRYPLHPSLTQYQESDGDFFDRQRRRHGVWQFFRQSNQGVEYHLGDGNHQFPRYGSVKADHILMSLANSGFDQDDIHYYDEIQLHQSNERTPLNCFSSTAKPTSVWPRPEKLAKLNQLSPFVELNQAQLDTLTQSSMDSVECRKTRLAGQFLDETFDCGDVITINIDQPAIRQTYEALKLTGELVIDQITMSFRATTSCLNGDMHYQQDHHFAAYPLHVPYRPHLDIAKDREQAPKHIGLMDAVTTYLEPHDQNINATPDDIGRVPLNFPFRYQVNCNGHACRYVRTCTTTNSSVAGVSFPLYKDTECVVTFARGELDRPIFVGAVANADTGHLLSDTHQLRSEIKLPQGQYLKHSNLLGKHHWLEFGTKHKQHTAHSFQRFNTDGTHFIQSTSEHYQHCVTGNFVEVYGVKF